MTAAATPWRRVTAHAPCPVCGRADWCLLAHDGGAAICARVESPKRTGGAGWLHRLRDDGWRPDGRRVATIPLDRPDGPDFAALAERDRRAVDPLAFIRFAATLGVGRDALTRLGVGWAADARNPETDERGAWTWPMRDAGGRVVGIRTRFASGAKRAVRGSRDGLFVPTPSAADDASAPLLIAEGPTDAAALVTFGLFAIGRPSCLGAVPETCRYTRGRHVAVVADADAPGRRGALALANRLALDCASVRIVTPPAGLKDVRCWLNAGATADDVRAAIDAAPVGTLEVKTGAALY